MTKEYRCAICNEKLDYKPIRMTIELYGAGKYKQYYPVKHFDFCKKHWKNIKDYINNKDWSYQDEYKK